MSDMTEHAIGSVDAVADSLIEQPVAEEEQLDLVDEQEASQPDEEIQQDDQGDEPEEVEQDEDVEEDEELGSDNEELFYTVKIDGEEKKYPSTSLPEVILVKNTSKKACNKQPKQERL